jgi:hypothetical protein
VHRARGAGVQFIMPKTHRKGGHARSRRAIAKTRYGSSKLKARDLPIPRLISETHFKEICSPYRFSDADRTRLLGEINAILKDMGEWMRENPLLSLGNQRDSLRSAAAHIKKARKLINKRAYQFSLGFTAATLAPMLSSSWLGRQFPKDELAPKPVGLVGFVDDEAERLRFIDDRPLAVFAAILNTVEAAFAESLRMMHYMPGSKGGPKPLKERKMFITMLAIKWQRLGRHASTSPNSDFVAFIDNIMDAIGWPSDLHNEGAAVVAAIADAMKHRRNLTEK